MTPSDLQAVMETAARMGLLAGAFGALYFRAAVAAVALLGRALVAWGARRSRILRARMRNVHGPLLLPDAPRWLSRAVVAAALRRKHQAMYG